MKKVTLILALLLFIVFVSCYLNKEKTESPMICSEVDSQEDTVATFKDTTILLANNIDKVVVWAAFFGRGGGGCFELYISNSEIKNVDCHNENKFHFIEDINTKNKIIHYINLFYIEKTEKIYYKRTQPLEPIITDYPFIRVKGYRKNKKIFEMDIDIGTGNRAEKGDTIILENGYYRYEYNPKFIKFYELLESFVSE